MCFAASNLNPSTPTSIHSFNKEKTGNDLYAYGEILNSCESGRKLSIYTDKYFGVTDNEYSDFVILKAGAKKVSEIASQNYIKDCEPNKLVLWAESHDTYEGSDIKVGQTRVDRAYSIVASRKDATALYFARPDVAEVVGQEGTSNWESEVVGSVNRFHNRFVGADEELYAGDNTTLVIERFNEKDAGAVLVNTAGDGLVEIQFKHLKDGKYYDSITGNVVDVVDGKGSVRFTTSGVVVLTNTPCIARPTINVGTKSTLFVQSIEIELKTENAESAYYQINGGEKVSFDGKTTVKLNSTSQEQETFIVKVTATNGKHTKEKEMEYTTLSLVPGYVNVVNLSTSRYTDTDLYIWAWNSSGLNVWTNDYEIRDGILLFDPSKIGASGFLLATFPKGHKISDVNKWDSGVLKQTSDISGTASFFDASSF